MAESKLKDLFYLLLYLAVLLSFAINIPKSVSIYYEDQSATICLGMIVSPQ